MWQRTDDRRKDETCSTIISKDNRVPYLLTSTVVTLRSAGTITLHSSPKMSSPASIPQKGSAQKSGYMTAQKSGYISIVPNPGSNNTGNATATATASTNAGTGKEKVARKANIAARQTHSRSYPRGVGLDFRKLAGITLINYIDHHGMSNVTID